MKNKLFYFLWLGYIAIVIFILNINQVFTSGIERTSMEKLNLALNLGFLLLIGVLFVVSTLSFINLNKVTAALSKVTKLIQKEDRDSYDMNGKAIWAKLNNQESLFNNPTLDKAMSEYRAQLKRTGNSFASAKFVSINDFINEPLLEKAGMSYFNSAMPGTLTGLGILGTFIGLSLGLASFSGNDIYTISDNVGPLLSGMKVAFHTSVYGIFFSLIYTFIYRGIMSDAYEKLDRFLTAFRHFTNPANQESESAAAMLVYQANTAALLKEILAYMKGTSKDQTEALSTIVDQFCNQLNYTLGTELKGLGQALNEAGASQAGSAELFRSLTETNYQLIEANRQMTEVIDGISKEQKEIVKKLMRQERKLDAACDEISARLFTYDMSKDFIDI